jgi:hypothetical protein
VRIKLKSLVELEQRLKKLAPNMERGLRAIARNGARLGATRGVTHARRAGIRASGTYEQSFVAHETADGAVVGNAAEHAVFVEVGRRPGRRPPLAAILKWLVLKGLISLKLPRMSDREARRGIAQSGTGVTGDAHSGKQRARLKVIARRRVDRYKRGVRKKHVMAAMGIAFGVQKKIGARGTKGKRIMRSVHKDVARYVKRELRRMARMLR